MAITLVIPALLLRNASLVKTAQFKDPKNTSAGVKEGRAEC